MNIYEIGQDFDNYKFFVFKEDDESNKGVWDYNGQSLINEWKGLSLELFRDKRKKKDKRSEEFDASCYFSGCLIVGDSCLHHMSGTIKFMALLQILPAVFRFFYNKKGIKIAIRLLCLFDDVNDLIRTRFQLIVRLYRKRIGDTL